MEEQETMTKPVHGFTVLNLKRAPLLGVPGVPAGQGFALKVALVILDEPIQR
jgi:hypothetical protein